MNNEYDWLADKLLSIYNIEDILALAGVEEQEVLEYLIRSEFIEIPEEFIPI